MIHQHNGIKYEDFDHPKYKYRLLKSCNFQLNVPILIEAYIPLYARLSKHGYNPCPRIFIEKGYAWDGPSGPTFDTPDFMRGSLIHDVLYQMIREESLTDVYRPEADKVLYQICREDGMPLWRAWYVWMAVRWFGHKAVKLEK